MVSAISTLIGEELEGRHKKWIGTVAGSNGSLYGIPYSARRVAKFNPLDKSIAEIGPDFGEGWKWYGGAITDSGVIYCPPFNSRGILKIDTKTDNVTELDSNLLPERGNYKMWMSCALALDGCIYFMPACALRIMKLDPNNGDAMSSVGAFVGDDLEEGGDNYSGTVVGIDGCVYGIPRNSKRIVKYDPINDTTSFVGKEADEDFECSGDGVLARDGCIYATATMYGKVVLKIDTTNNTHRIVGSSIELNAGWYDGILGIDGCIYWPPYRAARILKYDPHSNLTSLVGDDFGTQCDTKWSGGCAAPDGIIYCLPSSANRILTIDPLKEYTLSLKNNMEEHPEQLGCLFHPSDDIPDDTNFDRAVTKFGQKKVLELLDECMPPIDRVCTVVNVHPFMIAASLKNSRVSVIYHLLRQMPSSANCTNHFSDV